MAGHYLQLVVEGGEPRIAFVCANSRGDGCHRRVPNAEDWEADDPRLMDTDTCWAVEWWDEGGIDALTVTENGVLADIPVEIAYDEGIVATPKDGVS